MKKIYNYHTGELVKEALSSQDDKRSLNESISFDDIITSQRELHNDNELKAAALSPSEKPVVIWEFRGNRCAESVEDLLDDNNIDYCSLSVRALRGDASKLNEIYAGESFIVLDDFTFGDPAAFSDLLDVLTDLMTNEDVSVVCVGKIDAENNEALAETLVNNFINFIYSPQADRQSTVGDDEEFAYESVSDKFAKYRKLYESDDEDSSDEAGDREGEGDKSEEGEGEDKGEEGDQSEEGEGEDKGDEDETEDVPMTAIVLTVKKDDVDKCKEELVDAGIPEDAISEVDTEDDEENGKLKVDADYALELKDYLKGKGIDLEEKIGGEIVDDSAEDSEEGEGEDKEEDKDKEGEGEDKEDGEIDFDSEFGDLFGDEE